MNPINIYFYMLASILGLESARIVSQKVNVTINPIEKTFQIHQEDLFSIVVTTEDSLAIANELQHILEFHQNNDEQTAYGLLIDEIVLSNENKQVNAVVKGRYTDPEVLSEAGIYLAHSANPTFSLINIPDWNIRSAEAVLMGNYWNWPADMSATITMEPYNNIPTEYLKHRRSLLPYWEQWMEHQSKK